MGILPMAEPSSSPTIVRCADEMRAICYDGYRRRIVLCLVLWCIFGGLAWLLKAEWIGAIAIGGMMVIGGRHLLRIHRGYAGQRCPACGQAVGAYETRKNRIHLVCRHCGTVTITDCAIYVMGGFPEKVG